MPGEWRKRWTVQKKPLQHACVSITITVCACIALHTEAAYVAREHTNPFWNRHVGANFTTRTRHARTHICTYAHRQRTHICTPITTRTSACDCGKPSGRTRLHLSSQGATDTQPHMFTASTPSCNLALKRNDLTVNFFGHTLGHKTNTFFLYMLWA